MLKPIVGIVATDGMEKSDQAGRSEPRASIICQRHSHDGMQACMGGMAGFDRCTSLADLEFVKEGGFARAIQPDKQDPRVLHVREELRHARPKSGKGKPHGVYAWRLDTDVAKADSGEDQDKCMCLSTCVSLKCVSQALRKLVQVGSG